MGVLISVATAAAELGVSRVTLHHWITEGRIEAHTLEAAEGKRGRKGVKRWLLRSDVERLAREQWKSGD